MSKIKSLSRLINKIVLLHFYFIIPLLALSQDSIRTEDLAKFSYDFDIEDGVFTGAGAEILMEAVTGAHILMLGNNSRNQMESELDLALAPLLNKYNYNTLVMEIGSASAQVANRLSTDPTKIIEEIKKLNQSYFFEADGLLFMPIPDLKYLGTGELLRYTKDQNWSFAGIGTESWTSYKMILAELYKNLTAQEQKVTSKEYQASILLLDILYSEMSGQSNSDLLKLCEGLKKSKAFNKFLDQARKNDDNLEILESLNFSIDYWWKYGKKEFYEKNNLNFKRNKVLLKKELVALNYNFEEDKLFLKMYRDHLAKGVTPNGFYGVGNMLMELADYNGRESLTIGVLGRFTEHENGITDILENDVYVPSAHQPFIRLGQKDVWTLVDLRPFNKVFYWGNYVQTVGMQNMMRRYDLIIIPKADRKAEVNH